MFRIALPMPKTLKRSTFLFIFIQNGRSMHFRSQIVLHQVGMSRCDRLLHQGRFGFHVSENSWFFQEKESLRSRLQTFASVWSNCSAAWRLKDFHQRVAGRLPKKFFFHYYSFYWFHSTNLCTLLLHPGIELCQCISQFLPLLLGLFQSVSDSLAALLHAVPVLIQSVDSRLHVVSFLIRFKACKSSFP